MRMELGHARSEGKKGGRKRAEEGEEQGRSEGGKLRGRYPEEDTGQYTVYRAQNNTQRGPCHCDFGITI